MTGEVLVGRYELRGLLGRGGMAEVRDGWDTRLDRPVAVKVLYPHQSSDPDARRRFEEEARSAAALSHPNIVSVHDFGEHDGAPFIVMERLPGHTLNDVIARGPMPPARVRAMLDDVLAALSVAHAAGVLHRDIKPANILLSAGGTLKVADFGIAKSSGSAHTAIGLVLGTMCYLSPERVMGAPASVSDDLYAVGVMGYEALLGRRAFPHDNPAALARAIIDTPPPPLRELPTGADPVLVAAVDRAMSRDPRHRFASAAQMRASLAGDVTVPVAPATSPPRPATRIMTAPVPPPAAYAAPPPPSRTHRYLLAAAAVLAFAIAALVLAMDPFSSPQRAPIETVGTSTTVPQPTSTTVPEPTTPPPTTVAPAIQPAPAPAEQPKGPGKKDENGRGPGNKPD